MNLKKRKIVILMLLCMKMVILLKTLETLLLKNHIHTMKN